MVRYSRKATRPAPPSPSTASTVATVTTPFRQNRPSLTSRSTPISSLPSTAILPSAAERSRSFTKPGQSTYHGDLFTTNSSAWMNARDPFSVSRAALGKQRYGFDLTGPLRRKGSDFVLNLEHRSIDNFAVVNAIGLDASGGQVPILQNVPAPQRLWIGMAKTDWQLGAKNTFIASFGAWHNHRENVGAGGTTLTEAAYDSEAYDHNLHITDVTTISAKVMHEARLGIEFGRQGPSPPTLLAPQLQVAGAFTSGGSTSGTLRDHEADAEFDDDAILNLSKHLIKIGIQSELLRERFRYFNNFNGTWLFGGGTAPVLDANQQSHRAD